MCVLRTSEWSTVSGSSNVFWLKFFHESLCWTALTKTGFWPGLRTHKKQMNVITVRILNYCPVSSLVQYLFEITVTLKCLLRKEEGKKKSHSQNLLLRKLRFCQDTCTHKLHIHTKVGSWKNCDVKYLLLKSLILQRESHMYFFWQKLDLWEIPLTTYLKLPAQPVP